MSYLETSDGGERFNPRDGRAAALQEQRRARALDGVRVAEAVAVTLVDPAHPDQLTHWAADIRPNGTRASQAFFFLVALREAWQDFQQVGGYDDQETLALLGAELRRHRTAGG